MQKERGEENGQNKEQTKERGSAKGKCTRNADNKEIEIQIAPFCSIS